VRWLQCAGVIGPSRRRYNGTNMFRYNRRWCSRLGTGGLREREIYSG
jgi:hypothetical protein